VEVRRYLKGPSAYVSLHDLDDQQEFIASIPHRRVWPPEVPALARIRP